MSQLELASSTGLVTADENALFPIREIAHQTGVNPVTLRTWEPRYGLIKPLRTAKGHRMYTLEHLDKIYKVLEWPIPAADLALAVNHIKPGTVLLYGNQRLNIEQLDSIITVAEYPLLLAGQAVTIHQDDLTNFTQLTCATDSLEAYHCLLDLNILPKH